MLYPLHFHARKYIMCRVLDHTSAGTRLTEVELGRYRKPEIIVYKQGCACVVNKLCTPENVEGSAFEYQHFWGQGHVYLLE